jgi:HSP20 family protein
MKALAPWTGFEGLRKEMERFFDRVGDWEFPELRPGGEWSPKVDFSETKDAYVVKAEIPGIDAKDIEVALDAQALSIKGEKKQEKEHKDEQFYRTERSHGVFVRTIRLPGTVDGGKVTASFKNGLLTVTLPKAPGAKGAVIPIKAE